MHYYFMYAYTKLAQDVNYYQVKNSGRPGARLFPGIFTPLTDRIVLCLIILFKSRKS